MQGSFSQLFLFKEPNISDLEWILIPLLENRQKSLWKTKNFAKLKKFSKATQKNQNKTSVKRTSGTHYKPHIMEIRSAFFECALKAPNYRSRVYKFCNNFMQGFYTNFEQPQNFVKFYISSSKNLK